MGLPGRAGRRLAMPSAFPPVAIRLFYSWRLPSRPASGLDRMVPSMPADPTDVEDLVRRAASGDPGSWEVLLKQYRTRLRRMVTFRLDPRLRGRVDPSDVVQDVCLEAWQELGS